MEERIGVPLPIPNAELTEDLEVNLARMAAEGGKQLNAQHKQNAAQQQAQKQAEDPVFKLQQQEVQAKVQEVQRKAQKDQADAQAKQAEAQRKAMKDQTDAQLSQQKMQLEAQLAQKKLEIEQAELELEERKSGAKQAADRRRDTTKLDMDLLNMRNANNKPKGDK